jgi:hypothetical protein
MSLRNAAARLRAGFRSLRSRIAAQRPGLAKLGWRLAAAGSLVFIVLLVHRSVYQMVMEAPQFRMPKSNSRAAVAPRWADPAAAEGVVTLPVDRAHLMDPDLVGEVAGSFSRNPWVRRVVAVERLFPDQVRVRLEMRAPRLAVRTLRGYALVDGDGVRLPGVYARPPVRAMEVLGAAGAPPAPGRRWEGAEIAAALEMASLAGGEEILRALRIRAVDVSNLNGRRDAKSPDLALLAASGASIGWGRAPSSARFGEPAIGEKLDNLRRAVENYPGLEGVASVKVHQKGPALIKVADAGLVRRPK